MQPTKEYPIGVQLLWGYFIHFRLRYRLPI